MLFNPLFIKTPDVPGIKQNDNPSFATKKTNYLFSEIIKILYNQNKGESVLQAENPSQNNKIEMEVSGSDLSALKKFINALNDQNSGSNKKSSKKSAYLTVSLGQLVQLLQNFTASSSQNHNTNAVANGNNETNGKAGGDRVIAAILEKLKNDEPVVLYITNGNEHIQMQLENVLQPGSNTIDTQNPVNTKLGEAATKSQPDVKLKAHPDTGLNKVLTEIQSNGSEQVNQVDTNKASTEIPLLKGTEEKSGQGMPKDIPYVNNDPNIENNSTVKVKIQYIPQQVESVTNHITSVDLKKIIDPGTSFLKEAVVSADKKTGGGSKSVTAQSSHISKEPGTVTGQSIPVDSKKIIEQIPLAENIKEAVIKEEGNKNKGTQITDNVNANLAGGKNNNVEVVQSVFPKNGQDTNSAGLNAVEFKKDESMKESVAILNSKGQNDNFQSADKSSNIQQVFKGPDLKTVQQSEVISEISKFIKQGDKSNITLKLMPEKLGTIKIMLDTAGKTVHARLEVANDSVKQMVVQNIDTLKTSLAQQGIQLASLNVSLTNQDSRSNKTYSSKKKSASTVMAANTEDNERIDVQKNMGYNTYEYLA